LGRSSLPNISTTGADCIDFFCLQGRIQQLGKFAGVQTPEDTQGVEKGIGTFPFACVWLCSGPGMASWQLHHSKMVDEWYGTRHRSPFGKGPRWNWQSLPITKIQLEASGGSPFKNIKVIIEDIVPIVEHI
jgi:hypothetical protein